MDIPNNETELDRLANKLENEYIGVKPLLLIIVIAVIIIYYYLFSSLGNNENGYTSSIKLFVEIVLWLLFIVLLLLNGISYIFDIDLIKTLEATFGKKTAGATEGGAKKKGKKDKILKLGLVDQVFHLPENKYNYNDAKALCNAYDARLATYDEVNSAYNSGADWCSYGWSADQMALYPTQKSKWQKLQNQKGHERDCGRPGVNGGYMDDAALTFGVNCYGSKPAITPCQAKGMRDKPLVPRTAKELEFDKKVDYWRAQLPSIQIAPFNHDNWSIL
jgi:hypothetical protein